MKSFQRRIFIVGINGRVRNRIVFQILDEVHREKTFPDAALSVDDGVDLFWHTFLFVKDFLNPQCAARVSVASTARRIVPFVRLIAYQWNCLAVLVVALVRR